MDELKDRLVDFARDRNFELRDQFEALRAELASGQRERARERLESWRALLDSHVKWEEGQVFSAYGRRCRPEDREGVEELVRDHRLLTRLVVELGGLLAKPDAAVEAELIRDLLDDIDAILLEHRVQEETQICAALDHVLDAPTIRHIEEACEAVPSGDSVSSPHTGK